MLSKKGKVFIGMSGGVDSSVAAALLKKQGYEVVGVHLKCFNVDGCAAQDAEDARRAAEHLGIPFYTFDFEKEYKEKVVEYMVDGYKKGITPNPDVMCNKEIKFGLFYKKAMEMGADFVTTGHYVRLVSRKNSVLSTRSGRSSDDLRFSSRRRGFDKAIISKPPSSPAQKVSENRIFSLNIAKDRNKDQSYFLWTLKPEQLKHCLFPIGEYKKLQVRKMAVKFGLHNAAKKDSQGICFLGQVSLPDFLKKYIKPKKGPIIIASDSRPSLRGAKRRGNLTEKFIQIGTHNGSHFYTIGQRHGLNIGGFEKPLYVAEKDIKKNIIVVAEGEDHPSLYKKEVSLTNVNLFSSVIASDPPIGGERGNLKLIPVLARVRYRQPLVPAVLVSSIRYKVSGMKNSHSILNTGHKILFKKPVKFVAPGQSAVFYDKKGAMLGGGVIV